MNMILLPLILISQPVLPELPPPPELDPHAQRPFVLPLENDTVGVDLVLGSPFGFDLFFRQDGAFLSYRGAASLCERRDYYSGMERKARFALKNVFKSFQLSSNFDCRDFRGPDTRSFYTATVAGFLNHSNTLTSLEFQGYRSRMTVPGKSGGNLLARMFWQAPWFNTLFRVRGALDGPSLELVTDGMLQYQYSFILLTPSIQARFIPGDENPIGAGAALNAIAVFENLSLELNGCYNCTYPLLLDTFLFAPVTASISPDAQSHFTDKRLAFGFGYKGVEMNLFVAGGTNYFWTQDTIDSLPLLQESPLSQTGAELKIKLERPFLSNNGFLRIFFNEPETPWTPLWAFSDSITARYKYLGAFAILDACAARSTLLTYEAPYIIAGAGMFYELEPFRAVLRVDDILDRRPRSWPGLASPGRRVSLSVTLFSSKW